MVIRICSSCAVGAVEDCHAHNGEDCCPSTSVRSQTGKYKMWKTKIGLKNMWAAVWYMKTLLKKRIIKELYVGDLVVK